jgi:serine/threonine-protein kinase
VYSTGVLLYELLAGRTPFAGAGPDFSVAYRHVSSRPPRIPVDDALWEVLDALLSKDPARRPTPREAASTIRRLMPRLTGSAPLARADAPIDFDAVERPVTVVRGGVTDEELRALTAVPAADGGAVPDLGEAGSATMVRPVPRREVMPVVPARPGEKETTPFWRTRKALLLAGTAAVLLAAMVAGFVVLAPADERKATAAGAGRQLSTQLQDPALPTGLTVSRTASYEPSSGKTRLTVEYGAQKAPLSGEFLEVIPGMGEGDPCPAVAWEEASVGRNQASVTGLDVDCGWKLSDLQIPSGGSVQVTATVPVEPADQQALDAWLRSGSEATAGATQDPAVKGTAYPVQRLTGVEVRTPARVVTPSPLKITLVPVWAGGADELNPIYVSPAAGKPSQMLTAVAGGEEGVRFADGCGGALAVDSSGLTVTALQITPECTLRASVGNFTDLQSPAFSITSRESAD